MTYTIRVICLKDGCPSRKAIEQFILDGVFFEIPPVFQPYAIDESEWTSFRIHYHSNKRPVIVSRHENDTLFHEERVELLRLARHNHIYQARQIIGLEIDVFNLTPEVWEMLDALESYLAKTLDGIIYAPDDGFYNEWLGKIE